MPWIIMGTVLFAIAVVVLGALYCYRRIFYSPDRIMPGEGEYEFPDGEIYEAHKQAMTEWVKQARSMPHQEFEVISHDGLVLKGKYYEYAQGAPLEILFHGYRGYGERDLSGGIERCFALGRNALIVDQRACGNSQGKTVTFGIKERYDCLKWVEFALQHFGDGVKIILTGVSMGAATVMMAAGEKLPPNVVCILADCGYSSPQAIIKKVIADMRLPAKLLYPIVKLGARLFGGFNLDEASPLSALKVTNVPIIFIHGDVDDFVPCDMSKQLYEVCNSKKSLVIIKGAGHGIAYPVDKEGYLEALREFEKVWNV